MADIIIAGQRRPLGDPEVKVVTFLDPGSYSNYIGSGPSLEAITGVDPDTGDERLLLRPRPRPAGSQPVVLGLQGAGWEKLDPAGAIAALRKVIHSVVLHHDGTASSSICYATLKQRGLSSHFMIDRDGTVYQPTDVADMAWHAGMMNPVSVGFDLNSTAINLLRQPDAPPPYGGVPSQQFVINGSPLVSWTYSEEQYRALIAVLRVLVDVLGIQPVFPMDRDGGILPTVLADPPPEQFAGIQCHWHSCEEKWDPGPGLDWERILAGLRKEDATFPAMPTFSDPAALAQDTAERAIVSSGAMGSPETARKAVEHALSSEEDAARLLRLLARGIERESGGGYYPVGVNQTWHGGIHIPCRPDTPIVPLLKGELVAAHLVPARDFPRDLGSNNFVLLRHRIPLPVRLRSATPPRCPTGGEAGVPPDQVPEQINNDLTVFSLYMHLDAVDWDHPPETGLFRKLPPIRKDLTPPPPPPGPTLAALSPSEQKDPTAALRGGYVALFSPVGKPESSIVMDTSDVLGFAGEFGEWRGDKRMVHVEVFADQGYEQAMDLALYGKYLLRSEDDPGQDLVVRSRSLLEMLGWQPNARPATRPQKKRPEPGTSKVLSAESIRQFFAEAGEGERESLRRLIVRHRSEWSSHVEWAKTLLENQEWRGLLREEGAERRWFQSEVVSWLRFTWLTDDVAKHLGLSFKPGEEGVVSTFHPVNFLLWWLFLRSAVRGKSLEEILRCLEGRKTSVNDGVPEVLGEFLDLPGQGEWEQP